MADCGGRAGSRARREAGPARAGEPARPELPAGRPVNGFPAQLRLTR
ncbi:hypothetical protein BURMUCGD2M_3398 [Burkholderia multivorans CGD2M]|uniref:Uncharacterized protein n=1 Tax=Burkholderia multivorans CGD2 TaxID=513052 RepID=B9BW77_9BURK|nr:hypothetical protein BURMUCGD2_3405 [Burkholderia multivorans CGD2]EEE10715.1 hypothetical protein BURMUCGD2M_3398 [Burkholderia multivorans CGD2M]